MHINSVSIILILGVRIKIIHIWNVHLLSDIGANYFSSVCIDRRRDPRTRSSRPNSLYSSRLTPKSLQGVLLLLTPW